MRMLLLAAAGLALAACTTPSTGDEDSPAGDPVTAVQNAARAACSFLPAAETVAELIAVGDPRLATASAIANAICNAISPDTPAGVMMLFKAAPTVDGVVIRGERVGR